MVLRALLSAQQTQDDLKLTTGLKQPQISKSLKELRTLGLVKGGRGQPAVYSLVVRDQLLALLQTADRLVEAVNEVRVTSQRAVSRDTRKRQLTGGGQQSVDAAAEG